MKILITDPVSDSGIELIKESGFELIYETELSDDDTKNIIEYYLDKITNKNGKLIDMSSRNFSDEVSRETPAPGGGSVSSYVGALGASLVGMVANLSCNTRGWENKVEIFSEKAHDINQLREKLLSLVDEDAHSFNSIMEA